jgi:hypothetical protein
VLALLAAASVGQQVPDLHVLVPSVQELRSAYVDAPAVRMVRGEPARRIQQFARDLGWDLAGVFEGLLPVADPVRPDDRLWPWSACRRASFTFFGLDSSGEPPAARSTWCQAEFADAEAAQQAAQALLAMAGADAEPDREIEFGGASSPVHDIGELLGVLEDAWLVRDGARLVVGAGGAAPEEYARGAIRAYLEPMPVSEEDQALLGPPSGAVLLAITSDLEQVPDVLGMDVGGGFAQAGAALLFPFLSAKGHWRLELVGDRFVTCGLYEPRGIAREVDAALGTKPLPTRATALVPPDAVGTWITTLDAARAEPALTELLALLGGTDTAPHPSASEGSPRLGDGLGPACAFSLLPIQSLMSPQPRLLCSVELTDATRFSAGLDAWIQRAQAILPGLEVERRPYRKVPTLIFSLPSSAGEESAPPESGLPFGVESFEPDRPTLAILSDRVVLASAPSVVRNEIKRLLDANPAAPTHAIVSGASRPAEAFEVSTMDWGAMLSKVYDGARGLAPMLAQQTGQTIDVEKLPSSQELFAPFRPTTGWSRRLGPRVLTRSESSFGPETPLGLAALAWSGSDALQRTPAPAPVPAAPAVSAPQIPEAEGARSTTQAALREVRTGIVLFRSRSGVVPQTLDELLRGTPEFPDGFLPSGKIPPDGWGRPLVYAPAADGKAYALRSRGADGVDQQGGGDDVLLN